MEMILGGALGVAKMDGSGVGHTVTFITDQSFQIWCGMGSD